MSRVGWTDLCYVTEDVDQCLQGRQPAAAAGAGHPCQASAGGGGGVARGPAQHQGQQPARQAERIGQGQARGGRGQGGVALILTVLNYCSVVCRLATLPQTPGTLWTIAMWRLSVASTLIIKTFCFVFYLLTKLLLFYW